MVCSSHTKRSLRRHYPVRFSRSTALAVLSARLVRTPDASPMLAARGHAQPGQRGGEPGAARGQFWDLFAFVSPQSHGGCREHPCRLRRTGG